MDERNIPHVTLTKTTTPLNIAVIPLLFGIMSGCSMYVFAKICVDRNMKNAVDSINVQLEAERIVGNI